MRSDLRDSSGEFPDYKSYLYAGEYLREFYRPKSYPLPEAPFWYREPGLWLPLSCAIAFIDSKSAVSADTVTATTAGQNSTGATLALVHVAYYDAIVDITASNITDSKGNTYTQLSKYVASGGNAGSANKMFYKGNPSVGASHTATVNGISAIYPGITLATFSGVTNPPFDVENGDGTAGPAATTLQPGSLTPSGNNYLIATGISMAGSNGSIAINSSFTIGSSISGAGGLGFGSALAYLIQGSAAAVNPQWSATAPDFRCATINSWIPIASASTVKQLAALGVG